MKTCGALCTILWQFLMYQSTSIWDGCACNNFLTDPGGLAILIHYFAKSVGCMELSFMVLCKIDKYYNQVIFWPRLKMGSSTVMFTVRIQQFLDSNRFARKHPKDCLRGSICRSELTWGRLKIFFAYLPSIAGYIARSCSLERKNWPVSEV